MDSLLKRAMPSTSNVEAVLSATALATGTAPMT